MRVLLNRFLATLMLAASLNANAATPFNALAIPAKQTANAAVSSSNADALRLKLPTTAVRVLLQPSQPSAVVQVALRLVASGELPDEVRSCLQHPDWRVREQATQQLAQQATPDDTPALARLLDDPRWDVRMGAAQALARLPYLSDEQLSDLSCPGQPGETVVRHVLAERAWA